jgi:hypothetical protein
MDAYANKDPVCTNTHTRTRGFAPPTKPADLAFYLVSQTNYANRFDFLALLRLFLYACMYSHSHINTCIHSLTRTSSFMYCDVYEHACMHAYIRTDHAYKSNVHAYIHAGYFNSSPVEDDNMNRQGTGEASKGESTDFIRHSICMVSVHVCMYLCLHVCMYVYLCMRVCTFTYTYINNTAHEYKHVQSN